jgi:hypothetical protein
LKEHYKVHPRWEKEGYRIREVISRMWTPFEATVWEQYLIDKNGGKAALDGGKDAMKKDTYDRYKKLGLFNPC